MPTSTFNGRQRAPSGVVSSRPVLMRLMPDERAALLRHAKAANSTLSAFARRMTLVGITQFEMQHIAKCVDGIPRVS